MAYRYFVVIGAVSLELNTQKLSIIVSGLFTQSVISWWRVIMKRDKKSPDLFFCWHEQAIASYRPIVKAASKFAHINCSASLWLNYLLWLSGPEGESFCEAPMAIRLGAMQCGMMSGCRVRRQSGITRFLLEIIVRK